MKTPEEIKKDVETCLSHPTNMACNYCKLFGECDGSAEHIINELYDLVLHLESSLEQVERERDDLRLKNLFLTNSLEVVVKEGRALKHDMENYCHHGSICKHFCKPTCPHSIEGCPLYPSDCEDYAWRGVCPENTKEEDAT